MSEAAPPPESVRLLERITAFSDGVIAIAITLLVLNIEVPETDAGESLGGALAGIQPTLITWLLSFVVIGTLWYYHHNVLSRLHAADPPFLVLNMAFLGFVSLVPFSSALISDYGDQALATAVYALNVVCGVGLIGVLGQLAKARGLVRPGATVPRGLPSAVPAGIFALSIPIAFVDPVGAQLTWALVAVSNPIERTLRRLFYERS
jgi:uncharacterized membrane protein